MYLRAAKTEAEEAGEETDGMASSVSKLRSQILILTKNRVDIMADDNTFKSTYQILKEISQIWDQLADVDQSRLLELMGGKRNANVLSSILTNFDVAEKSLETSLTSAGSAMAENDKYLDSIQGRLDQLSATFEKLSTQLLSSKAVKGFVSALKGLLNVLSGIMSIGDGAVGLFTSLALAITGVVLVLQKLSKESAWINTVSGGKLGAIIAGLALLVTIISRIVSESTSLIDDIKAANIEFQDSSQKLKQLNLALEENKGLLSELYQLRRQGSLSAEENARVSQLESENQLLEQQIVLEEDRKRRAYEAQVRTGTERMSANYTSDFTMGASWAEALAPTRVTSDGIQPQNGFQATSDVISRMSGSKDGQVAANDFQLLDLYAKSRELYGTQLSDSSGFQLGGFGSGVLSLFTGESQTWDEIFEQISQELEKVRQNLVWTETPTTDIQRDANQEIAYYEQWQMRFLAMQGQYEQLTKFIQASDIFKSLAGMSNEDIDNLEEGSTEYQWLAAMIDLATEAGIFGEEEFGSLSSAVRYLAQEATSASGAMGGLESSLQSFKETADGFTDGVDAINQAQKEMAQNGQLSVKTILALEDAGLEEYIKETANGYALASGALDAYLKLQRDQYQSAIQAAVRSAEDLIYKQTGVAASYDATAESMLRELETMRTIAYLNKYGAFAQAGEAWAIRGINNTTSGDTIYDAAIKQIKDELANAKRFEQLWAQYQKDLDKSSSSSSSQTAGDRALSAWKTRLNERKHLLEMGIITEKEYYQWLSDNYRKDLGDYSETLDERRSLDEDYYKWLKNQYKQDLDDQKKELQNKQNDLKDFYDKQKKMIEDAYDDADKEDKRQEYAKEIGRLETLIARLQLDTSQEAKRRLAEAQNELEKQRKDYNDWERGNTKDALIEALDAQYEAENKALEDQVSSIDETIESLDSTTSAIYDVIKQWATDHGYAVPQYARGTPYAFGGGAITQERASELIGMHVGQGRFTMLSPGSKVWNGVATENLYRFANAPASFISAVLGKIRGASGGYGGAVAIGDIVINGNATPETVAALRKERQSLVYEVLSALKKLK